MKLVGPAWEARAVAPELPDGAAHVWRVRADRPGTAAEAWGRLLLPAERERLGRFRLEADAQREAAGRGALRLLLGAYLGLDPLAVRVAPEPGGKPALAGGSPGPRIEFNVAHSGNWALLAFARGRRVGVDVEKWRDVPEAAALRDIFRPEELEAWARCPPAERPAAFFGAWTLKEAYAKGLGAGLALPLRSFRVPVAPGEEPATLGCAEGASSPWDLLRLDVGPGYSAALAAERGIALVYAFALASG